MKQSLSGKAPLILAGLLVIVVAGLAITAIVRSDENDGGGDGGTNARAFAGTFTGSFETSAFVPCVAASWERAWLVNTDPSFARRYDELVRAAGRDPLRGGLTVFVSFEGGIKTAKAGGLGFGHLGGYGAEVTLERMVDMRAGACPEPARGR